ncbi:hypothetical protein Golob_024667 [Gossypium lobatum]|uniref:CASP-like protein n=2 Tax=Gossypium TaxID=3633 RepID=A0A7J8NK20_9ROSI|nr:hypothetical protein [Gossypium lobatum]
MATGKNGETAINMPETKASVKGTAPLLNSSKAVSTVEHPNRGVKKGFAIGDFVLRLCALGAALGATVAMGNADQVLPFFTQFLQFEAQYDDFDTFRFFVMAMGMVSGYLFISLPFSIIGIIRPFATKPRLFLVIFDSMMAALTIAAGSASASMVYLAHNGNDDVNWLPFCQQFGDFCQSASGAVIAEERKKGFAVGDFILRLCTLGAALGSTVAIGNAEQLLPFFHSVPPIRSSV